VSEQSLSQARILFPQLGFGCREGCRKGRFPGSDGGQWFSNGECVLLAYLIYCIFPVMWFVEEMQVNSEALVNVVDTGAGCENRLNECRQCVSRAEVVSEGRKMLMADLRC